MLVEPHYRPTGRPRGLVVLAPGSRGGMGPGQTPNTIGKFSPAIRSIYSVLARKLADSGLAMIHFTWRLNPTRKGAPPGTLKAPKTLDEGVADIACAASFLRAAYGSALPLVLVGFSFGGPAVMAAAATALAATADADEGDGGDGDRSATGAASERGLAHSSMGPLAGVVTMGCGLRVAVGSGLEAIGVQLKGGASKARPRDYGGTDSAACTRAFAAAQLPLLMVHGLADVTVDPKASAAIFDCATGPKVAVWLRGADHHMRSRFDELIAILSNWMSGLVNEELTSQIVGLAIARVCLLGVGFSRLASGRRRRLPL
jgi:pimeloyl-ACP methyl ester carboxylesterase